MDRDQRQKEAAIEAEARKIANSLLAETQQYSASHPGEPDVCFCLILFEEGGPGGFLTYMANAERAGMIATLQELAKRLKAGE